MKMRTKFLTRRIVNALLIGGILAAAEVLAFELMLFSDRLDAAQSTVGFQMAVFLHLAILSGYVLFLRQYIYRPYRLIRTLEEDFDSGLLSNAAFEMPYAYSQSNRNAIRRMQEMIDQRKMMELSVKQSRYLALQNQINPHFLYNTLDAIRGDALLAGEERIADTIEALSTFFAYTISNIDQLATLHEELNHVRDYFCIQKYRFEERLTLKIEERGTPALGELYLPRVTLQPLVENAIYHGLESRGKQGTVTITAEETESYLILHVLDDGVGMDEATLAQLNARLSDTFRQGLQERRGGIWLPHVNSLFGEDYGLHVYSVESQGTDVRILLPKMTKEEIDAERVSEDPGWDQEG